ncbi:MAG TPA: nuclease-related domain-containing protein [Halomonas sp.]|nr:nuclease-related domain-containing protein [Halomonas sp.]
MNSVFKNQASVASERQATAASSGAHVGARLRHAFSVTGRALVFHNLTLGDGAQRVRIDHLIIHRGGFILIASQPQEEARAQRRLLRGQRLLSTLLEAQAYELLSGLAWLRGSFANRGWHLLSVVPADDDKADDPPAAVHEKIETLPLEALCDRVCTIIGGTPRVAGLLKPHLQLSPHQIRRLGRWIVDRDVAPDIRGAFKRRLGCRLCGETEQLSDMPDKQGYAVHCHVCNAPTSMRLPCTACGCPDVQVEAQPKPDATVYIGTCQACQHVFMIHEA